MRSFWRFPFGIGVVIAQVVDGLLRPIGFYSKTFSDAQLKWTINDKELFAFFKALRKFYYYLVAEEWRHDHRNLRYLNNYKILPHQKMQQRWISEIQNLNSDIEFIPGTTNTAADALSRINWAKIGVSPEQINFLKFQPVKTEALLADQHLSELISLILIIVS